ncbi:MAG: hypothetical protein GX605_04885, partial [Chloroflexi bacterium]|nr:hypothetical protein [Chloroflexota bacterium]
MEYYLGPGLEIKGTIGPQLVIANNILLLNSAELEQSLEKELSENPALEMEDVARCPRCGAVLSSNEHRLCARCNHQTGDVQPLPWESRTIFTSSGEAEDEWTDPIMRLAAPTSLGDYLLQQLGLTLEPEEGPLARFLVDSLDQRGFLTCSDEDICQALGLPLEKVQAMVARLQELDPPGVGARDAQESLLIQLDQLAAQGRPVPPLAFSLVGQCWQSLARGALRQVQRTLGATAREIQDALGFLASNLTPYPAMAWWESDPVHAGGAKDAPVYVRPDVVLSEGKDGQ